MSQGQTRVSSVCDGGVDIASRGRGIYGVGKRGLSHSGGGWAWVEAACGKEDFISALRKAQRNQGCISIICGGRDAGRAIATACHGYLAGFGHAENVTKPCFVLMLATLRTLDWIIAHTPRIFV